MLIIVQPDPNWELSLAQLSPSLLILNFLFYKVPYELKLVYL